MDHTCLKLGRMKEKKRNKNNEHEIKWLLDTFRTSVG